MTSVNTAATYVHGRKLSPGYPATNKEKHHFIGLKMDQCVDVVSALSGASTKQQS